MQEVVKLNVHQAYLYLAYKQDEAKLANDKHKQSLERMRNKNKAPKNHW